MSCHLKCIYGGKKHLSLLNNMLMREYAANNALSDTKTPHGISIILFAKHRCTHVGVIIHTFKEQPGKMAKIVAHKD